MLSSLVTAEDCANCLNIGTNIILVHIFCEAQRFPVFSAISAFPPHPQSQIRNGFLPFGAPLISISSCSDTILTGDKLLGDNSNSAHSISSFSTSGRRSDCGQAMLPRSPVAVPVAAEVFGRLFASSVTPLAASSAAMLCCSVLLACSTAWSFC